MTEWKAPVGHRHRVKSPEGYRVPTPRVNGKTYEEVVIEELMSENAALQLELMQKQDVIASYQKYFAERHHYIYALHREVGYDSGLSCPQVDTVQIRDILE